MDKKDSTGNLNSLLMGNFTTKKEVVEKADTEATKESLKEELRKKALASLGGSMVYMERTDLVWSGEDE